MTRGALETSFRRTSSTSSRVTVRPPVGLVCRRVRVRVCRARVSCCIALSHLRIVVRRIAPAYHTADRFPIADRR